MKQFTSILLTFSFILLNACIGKDYLDDFAQPVLRINNPLEKLGVSKTHQFNATYFNNVGQSENATIMWSTTNEMIIDNSGLATAIAEGDVVITAKIMLDEVLEDENMVSVEEGVDIVTTMIRTGSVQTTSSYELSGDFTLEQIDTNTLKISLASNYVASSSLPGLYVYLTNNPNSVDGAYEIGATSVFSGEHNYEFKEVQLNDFNYLLYWCKPFSVKVGGGDIN